MLLEMLTMMEIKTLILHVSNLMTMLALMLNYNRWRWIFLKESRSLKLYWSLIILNINGHFFIICNTYLIFVFPSFLPKFDDEGTITALEHIRKYEYVLRLLDIQYEDVVCRIFPFTFEGKVSYWYFVLPMNTIHG